MTDFRLPDEGEKCRIFSALNFETLKFLSVNQDNELCFEEYDEDSTDQWWYVHANDGYYSIHPANNCDFGLENGQAIYCDSDGAGLRDYNADDDEQFFWIQRGAKTYFRLVCKANEFSFFPDYSEGGHSVIVSNIGADGCFVRFNFEGEEDVIEELEEAQRQAAEQDRKMRWDVVGDPVVVNTGKGNWYCVRLGDNPARRKFRGIRVYITHNDTGLMLGVPLAVEDAMAEHGYYAAGVKKYWGIQWTSYQADAARAIGCYAEGGNTYHITGSPADSIDKVMKFVKESWVNAGNRRGGEDWKYKDAIAEIQVRAALVKHSETEGSDWKDCLEECEEAAYRAARRGWESD